MGDRHVVFSVDDFDGERSYIGFAFKALSERTALEIDRSDRRPR